MFCRSIRFACFAVLSSLLVLSIGCRKAADSATSSPPPDAAGQTGTAHAHDDHEEEFHSHDHGPQGGILAILGSHQFHVEFMPNAETGDVTAFVYNDRFKPVALDTKELTLNIMSGDQPKQYTLLVDHDGSDNKAATFRIADVDLAKLLKDGWTGEARVSITVNGNPAGGRLIPLKK